jgi:hypothetical protein
MNYLNGLQLTTDAHLACGSHFFLTIHKENTSKVARTPRIVSYCNFTNDLRNCVQATFSRKNISAV